MSVFLKIVSVTYATHTHLFKPRCKSPWHVWCGQCTKFFTRCGATIGYNGLSVWTKYDRPLSIHEENLWQTLVNSWRKFSFRWFIVFIPDWSITSLRENRWVQGPCLNYSHYIEYLLSWYKFPNFRHFRSYIFSQKIRLKTNLLGIKIHITCWIREELQKCLFVNVSSIVEERMQIIQVPFPKGCT